MRTFQSVAFVMVVSCLTAAVAARQAGHPKEAHQHAEAAKLQNPVPADDASIAAGKKLYDDQCAGCHGDTGKGDGPMAAYTGEPVPSNLADADWKHGSTDGEIYTAIHDGVEGTAMKDFKSDLKANEIWQVVHYVKTLGPKPAKNH
jgi:mono/diheme cytochrome c family protein